MFDCANVEMRELLPDLVAGTLDAATRARVERHLATCAECASELETLRLVRLAFRQAPDVDLARIVAALPRPGAAAGAAARRPAPIKRWMDWRIAAALTTVTVGTLSLAVSQRLTSPADSEPRDTVVAELPRVVPPGNATPRAPHETASVAPTTPPRPIRPASAQTSQLSVGGGVSDLDDAAIRALMGALDEIDRAPLAPSAEPDRTPVLPVIREGQR